MLLRAGRDKHRDVDTNLVTQSTKNNRGRDKHRNVVTRAFQQCTKTNRGREKYRNVDTNIVARSSSAPKPTGLRFQKFLERRNERILHEMSDMGSKETPDYGLTGRRNI